MVEVHRMAVGRWKAHTKFQSAFSRQAPIYRLSGGSGVEFFDLMGFDDALAKIYLVIGHVPPSNLSSEDERAIDGIAYARGIIPYEKPDKMLSLEALKKNKRIKERFCDAFPKISLDEGG